MTGCSAALAQIAASGVSKVLPGAVLTAEAITLDEQTLDAYQRLLGLDHPGEVGAVLHVEDVAWDAPVAVADEEAG
jgi:hypothetical protein